MDLSRTRPPAFLSSSLSFRPPQLYPFHATCCQSLPTGSRAPRSRPLKPPESQRPRRRRRPRGRRGPPLPTTLKELLEEAEVLRDGCINGGKDTAFERSRVHALCVALLDHGFARTARDLLVSRVDAGLTVKRATTDRIMRGLSSEGKYVEAEELLRSFWGVHRSNPGAEVVDFAMVAGAVDAAVKGGRVDVASNMIREMETAGVGVGDALVGSMLVKGYGSLGRRNSVEKILDRVRSPDTAFLNAVIDAFVRCEDFAAAEGVLERFGSLGLRQDVKTFNPLIRGYARVGNVKELERVAQMMVDAGIEPDGVSANGIIDAFVRVGDFGAAANALSKATNTYSDASGTVGLSEDQCVAYAIVVSGLSRSGYLMAGRDLLDEMSDRVGLALRSSREDKLCVAVTALISGYFATKHGKDGLKLFREMENLYGTRPAPDTVKAVLKGLSRERDFRLVADEAQEILEDFIREYQGDIAGTLPSDADNRKLSQRISCADVVAACNILLDALCRIGDMERAETIFVVMEEVGCRPDVFSFTTLISAYGRDANVVDARNSFLRMRNAGVLPDRAAMNALLGACVRSRKRDMATIIFDEMQRAGGDLSPNLTTYSGMIALHVQSNDLNAAWDTYEDLKANGLTPNSRVIERVMAACVLPRDGGSRPPTNSKGQGNGNSNPRQNGNGNGTALPDEGPWIYTELDSAWKEFGAEVSEPELREEMLRGLEYLKSGGGWSSQRVSTLMRDMASVSVPEATRLRWQSALASVWLS